MGQVTPLYKKDEELSKANNRPVTVLPALNNIFEKLFSSQLGLRKKYYQTTYQHTDGATFETLLWLDSQKTGGVV